MTSFDHLKSKKLIVAALISGIVAGIISSIHHWYGAIAYDTPWRASVAHWIMTLVLVVYSLLYVYWRNLNNVVGQICIWLFLLSAVIFQAGFVTFECVYSHVLKNILFFGGASEVLLKTLFPAPAYHLPNNVFFEVTGNLQLIGFVAVWYGYRVFSNRLQIG
jgi:hypothetical protein